MTRNGKDESVGTEAITTSSKASSEGSGDFSKTALVLLSDSLGQGDLALGHKLMLGFLRTTLDTSPRPWRLVLLNHGVRLATVEDVALMRQTVGPNMGVKAAGGIRTLADAKNMIAAGANRLGTSGSVAIIQETQ